METTELELSKARFWYEGMEFTFAHGSWDDTVKIRGRSKEARRWLKAKTRTTEYDNYYKVEKFACRKFFAPI